ncbi:MAG: methyl-accepting chemotaxis protein [Cellulosilyticaceae bacterium]
MKISSRLLLICVFMQVLMIGIFGINYIFYKSAIKDANTIYNNSYKPSMAMDKAMYLSKENENNLITMVLDAGNKQNVDEAIKTIEKNIIVIDQCVQEYESIALDRNQQVKLEKINDSLQQVRIERKQIIDEITQNNIPGAQEGLSKIRPIMKIFERDMEDLQNYNLNQAMTINNTMQSKYTKATIIVVILDIAGVLGVLGLMLLLGKNITRPIKILNRGITDLVDKGGDLTQTINIKRKDEVGALATVINKFINVIKEIVINIKSHSTFAIEAAEVATQGIEKLRIDVEDISATTQELSANMQETASCAEQMAMTCEGLKKSVERISFQVAEGLQNSFEIKERANRLASKANTEKEKSYTIYKENKKNVEESIEESKNVENIQGLVESILRIADQTNLLALNATIEAARAGNAGRGFSVVANEIQKLSEECRIAAEKIQEISKIVIHSVSKLVSSTTSMQKYIADKVTADYSEFVNLGELYSKDADLVSMIIGEFKKESNEILEITKSLVETINQVTIASAEGARGTTNIAVKTMEIVEKTVLVTNNATKSKDGLEQLQLSVNKFVVDKQSS